MERIVRLDIILMKRPSHVSLVMSIALLALADQMMNVSLVILTLTSSSLATVWI